jgi:hypothetical protein
MKRTGEGSRSQSKLQRRRSSLVPSAFMFVNGYSWE